MRPRLGVVSYGPIQYHTPLWQLLTKRFNVELDVLFLSDRGFAPTVDPSFGVSIAWDIDLLSGYAHHFLTTTRRPVSVASQISALTRWVPAHDAVVVNGYTNGWMLLAMAICRLRGVPYLLRGSSHPEGQSAGLRRRLRPAATRVAVAGSGGALSMGRLNEEFYRRSRARSVTFAPNSVDDARFAAPPPVGRSDLLARWGLKDNLPVILFSGKLIPRKRPLDLVAAIKRLPYEVNTLFVGDGSLAETIRAATSADRTVVTGFINQSDIPAYYHAADILVLPSEVEAWGLVVNEAMAAGTLPVVSDQVGCAPDLARGAGEIFRCADVPDLAGAIDRAVTRLDDPGTRNRILERVAEYSLELTAIGFERAALRLSARRPAR
jgi:glycosyltransferase involved in cell wall biosynthesis